MAVYAVVTGVKRAILEPFDGDIALERRVFDDAGFFEPVEALGLYGPEDIRLVDRAIIHGLVARLRDVDVIENSL